MPKNDSYDFLAEYYDERVATDLANFMDSAQLEEYVEWVKENGSN